MRAAIVVLSDLGRAHRMQRYARMWAAGDGDDADLVGLEGTPLEPGMEGMSRLTVHRLNARAVHAGSLKQVGRFVFASGLRALRHALSAFVLLMRLPKPAVIFVANPPAVPALAVAWLVSRLRGALLVIDWHDLSHRRAAAQLGEGHRLVRSIARSERRGARRAPRHVAASAALAEWLQREYRIKATVLYDRPLRALIASGKGMERPSTNGVRRGPLVVCPTNWGAGEDFDLLLEALERTDRNLSKGPATGRLTLLLTGTGELRSAFETRLSRRQFANISVQLGVDDSPQAIAGADIGLCLHQSPSGLDLPIVLSDFRGAGVPACAYDYAPVLSEVLTVGHEGVRFGEPGELTALLTALASGDLAPDSPLAKSRLWLAAHPAEVWEDHWQAALVSIISIRPN